MASTVRFRFTTPTPLRNFEYVGDLASLLDRLGRDDEDRDTPDDTPIAIGPKAEPIHPTAA